MQKVDYVYKLLHNLQCIRLWIILYSLNSQVCYAKNASNFANKNILRVYVLQ
jgi:hypothetical protein